MLIARSFGVTKMKRAAAGPDLTARANVPLETIGLPAEGDVVRLNYRDAVTPAT
jgi:hypothetical protein